MRTGRPQSKNPNEFSVFLGALCAVMVIAGFVYDYATSSQNSLRTPAMVRIKKKNLKHFYEYKKCTDRPVITGFLESVKVAPVKEKKVCELQVQGWAWNDFNLSSTRFAVKLNDKTVGRALAVNERRDILENQYPCATTPGFKYSYTPVGGFFESSQVNVDLLAESEHVGDYLNVSHKTVQVPKECLFESDFKKFRLHNVKAVPAPGPLHDTRLVAIGFAPSFAAGKTARLVWKNKVTGERLETIAKIGSSRARIFSSAIRSPASSHAWIVSAYLDTMKDDCIAPPDDSSATVCH